MGRGTRRGVARPGHECIEVLLQVAEREEGEAPDISPLSDPAEELAEAEPEPPSSFPGREQGLGRPPPPECPPALDRPPFLVSPVPSRPPSERRAADPHLTAATALLS